MGNLAIWDALKQPPKDALKEIKGGRLTGKTDINPQWRYKAMTEQFGVCGVGWKYTIDKLWLEPVREEVCAFAEISLSIKIDGEWTEPIPGVGGSMLAAQETKGIYVSDEAYKMAITDALSVAMKMIGVAADIYAGLMDGSKYSTERKPAQKTSEKAAPPESKDTPATKPPHLNNRGDLYTRAAKFGLSPRDVLSAVKEDNPKITKEEEITDHDGAWRSTAKKFVATIKAASESTDK